ncbi:MAG: nucleotidyltransferase [bacterium]|nr:nucleotidyltransferase [bacterium]
MNLYDEFCHVVTEFQKAEVQFAVVGGLALAFYDQPRFACDIDLLVHSGDVNTMIGAFRGADYIESAVPVSFPAIPMVMRQFFRYSGEDYLIIDLLIGQNERCDAIVDQAIEQPWEEGKVRVVRREDLIWLKKQRGSDQDEVDIRKLSDDKTRNGHSPSQ